MYLKVFKHHIIPERARNYDDPAPYKVRLFIFQIFEGPSIYYFSQLIQRQKNKYIHICVIQLPVLVLGHLLKMAHVETFVKRWRDLLPAKSSNHISRKSFDEKRRFGQFALDVYDASVGGKCNDKFQISYVLYVIVTGFIGTNIFAEQPY